MNPSFLVCNIVPFATLVCHACKSTGRLLAPATTFPSAPFCPLCAVREVHPTVRAVRRGFHHLVPLQVPHRLGGFETIPSLSSPSLRGPLKHLCPPRWRFRSMQALCVRNCSDSFVVIPPYPSLFLSALALSTSPSVLFLFVCSVQPMPSGKGLTWDLKPLAGAEGHVVRDPRSFEGGNVTCKRS